MRSNYSIFTIFFCLGVFGCFQNLDKAKGDSIHSRNDDVFTAQDLKFINQDFEKYYRGYFAEQDSCFFRAFLEFYFDSTKNIPYRSFDNIYIASIEDSQIMFNFSVIKMKDSNESFFYGLYDIYDLMFSNKVALGGVIPYQNAALNEVLNKLIKGKIPEYEGQQRKLLEVYLINLYYTSFHKMNEIPAPFFDRILSGTQLLEKYRNQQNATTLDSLIARKRENIFILENDFFGAIIFEYHFDTERKIQITEYLLPKIDRIKQFLPDAMPPYLKSCR